ncbi:MAG: outer membrane lipoprotein-sorting protein [Pseudomonadales bacterium]|jgi:hypothetical protein|nr:outer membrane lipoprotein-sorting protein [Pseudomonadales bacterium]
MCDQLRSAWCLCLFLLLPLSAWSDDDALALARLVAERPANEGRTGIMHFHLESDGGRVRDRRARMIHSEREDVERIAIFFTAPAMIADTAFLSLDHDSRPDENWLYLPATDRVRRLPVSERGDAFMGTDLSYGDVKDNFKFPLEDWDFTRGPDAERDGRMLPVLRGTARSPEIAKETGYGAFEALVDPVSAFPVHIRYTDRDGDPLKEVEVEEIEVVGGAHTAMRFKARNLQTGHSTAIHFTEMRYVRTVPEEAFEPASLSYGVPELR